MIQTASTHKQFEIMVHDYLARHPDVPHVWRQVHDMAGGRTDLICWPDSQNEVFASLTDFQITVGTHESDKDYELFGRNMTDSDLAREAMDQLEFLVAKRLRSDS